MREHPPRATLVVIDEGTVADVHLLAHPPAGAHPRVRGATRERNGLPQRHVGVRAHSLCSTPRSQRRLRPAERCKSPNSDGAFQPDVSGVVPEPAIEGPGPFAHLVGGHLRQVCPVSSTVVVCPLDEGGTDTLCAFGFGDP